MVLGKRPDETVRRRRRRPNGAEREPIPMILAEILGPQWIKVPLTATTKEAAIEEMVDILEAGGALTDRAAVLEAVLARERVRTTGIGHGLAIPHAKTTGAPRVAMAIGKPATPLDFASIDRRPVELVILVVSPEDQAGPHIQALSRVSRLLSVESFRRELFAAASAEEIHHLLVAREQAYA